MASFNDCLTTEGQKVFALMAQGGRVTFTRVVLGDGILDNSVSEVDIKDVINPVVTLNIDSVTTSEDNKVTIRTVFQNTQLNPFYMREKGVYATVDGAEECLVFYANNGVMAEYVDVARTQLIEKVIKTVIVFSESDNINISLSSSDIAEIISDLEERMEDVEDDLSNHRHDNATQTTDGFMSADDKKSVDNYKLALGTVTGKTDSLEVDDSEILVTSKALKKIADRLTNEDNETFNFGIKDGVRGFYTDPSRADDCFIPFRSGSEVVFYFSGMADSNKKPDTSQSTEMSFEIKEKGKYSIIVLRNAYINAGYDVYNNTTKICTVVATTFSDRGKKEHISCDVYEFDCNVGDVVSISNIEAYATASAITALLLK